MSKTVVRGLSKSKGVSREPYAPGWYKFQVTGGEEKQSKSGNTMFVHPLVIVESEVEQPNGRKVKGGKFTAYFPITEAQFTVDKLADFVIAVGTRVASDDGYDPAKAVGKEFWGQLTMGAGSDGSPQANLSKCLSEEAYAERQTTAADAD